MCPGGASNLAFRLTTARTVQPLDPTASILVGCGPKGHTCHEAARSSLDSLLMSTHAVPSMQTHTAPPASAHVLAVDDDPTIREAIADYLGGHDFRVTTVADGRAMQTVLADDVVDLLVLDLRLAGEDGMALARQVRDESAIPIIMLTGRSEEADRVMGLELGADDYLTKPFSPRELLARIRAVLRRRRPEIQQGRPEGIRAYRFDGWELNLNTRRLKDRAGEAIPLSNGEFSLLVVFLGAPHRILSRDQLLDMSRLHGDDVYNRSVNTQVMRLRRKLETDAARPRYIRTERRAGYVFSVPVETVY
jgi:two-component system OmpR family response regulator